MYRQQDASAGAGHQHSFLSASTPSSSFSQTQFPSPLFALDPSLQISPHLTQSSEQHGIPRQQTPDRRMAGQAHGSMLPPTSVSPRMHRSVPTTTVSSSSLDRSLPPKDVTAATLTDAYVSFVFYCNPHFPLNTDTEMLRANFNNSPKSGNRDFETYELFKLIRKLDAKEIKTWGQLALDLGVEAPDPNKGQSVQKVQQYTVRLKRWMHAMHIDAFFEYLLGKQHSYFMELPPLSDPYPACGRDTVLTIDDLAIGALNPSFRPKRGRRRNSQAGLDEEGVTESAGGQDSLLMSAYPGSAHPDGFSDPWAIASAVTPQTFAPWASKPTETQTAVNPTAPSHLRRQFHDDARHVGTPHPMTAQPTSMVAHIDAAFEAEPKSAITPARKRRKHGPAVSSAWPSASAPGAKPRGRPPAGRNTQDGPFSTFPANPGNPRGATSAKPGPPDHMATTDAQTTTQNGPARPPLTSRQSEGSGKPGRLSLQVPQHTGGPVRLATPPPRVLVNGEANDSEARSSSYTPSVEHATQALNERVTKQRVIGNGQPENRDIPGFAYEVLKRVLTNDLLRATLVGRQQRLNGDEAKKLSDAVLERMCIPKEDTEEPRDDIARLTAASWLGLGEQLNVPLGPATSHGKRINVTRFRMDREGYEEIVSAQEDSSDDIREVFDLSWTVSMANCSGNFELKGLTFSTLVPLLDDDSHDAMLSKALFVAKQIGIPGDQALKQSMLAAAGMKQYAAGVPDTQVEWKARCIPQELRDCIYDYALQAEHPETLSSVSNRACKEAQAGVWTLNFDKLPPCATYLSLLRCNQQLYREITAYLANDARRSDVAAKLDVRATYPHMLTAWTRIPRPPTQAAQDLHIAVRMRSLFDPGLYTRQRPTILLQPLFEILRCYSLRGPYFARAQRLRQPLKLRTVRLTLSSAIPFENLVHVYGSPAAQLEALFRKLGELIARLARSGLLVGTVAAMEVCLEGQDTLRVPVTSNIFDEQDYVFFANAGFRWDQG
ncbi:hypothetical protein LTS09_011946 [Friedmanniomyces endolithicus]|nr:hypothetical protein LTS09_011946 [Friedmanniomyces endolithicus]